MLAFVGLVLILLGTVSITLGYQVGVGIYDMTGPSVEVNFMGYALPSQRGSGIHLRLRARAFTFYDEESDRRFAFVNVDGGMGSDLVNMRVVDALKEKLGQHFYSFENLAISGTHSHSGPAGFLQYVLYQATSLGFVQETFDAWVTGISEAIVMAHNNMKPAKVMLAQGLLYDSNINRSPTSYVLNPEEERDQYPEGDTDKNMFLLNLLSADTLESFGSVNWFAVHGTSMNNTNTLTSGDNKGYAEYALEKHFNGEQSLPGTGPYVGAFASTNLGDVSPNTNGAKCIDTGLDCDGETSSCNGKCENCIAFGPGTNGDMFESTQIIGDKQFQRALELLDASSKGSAFDDGDISVLPVEGAIDYRHCYVKMSTLNVTLSDGSSVQLCSPSMGYSFAAGTTDGPGAFNFTQGTTTGNPFWDKVGGLLSEPTEEEIACQAPKPILLNTGDIDVPYEWDPETVPLQILRLGNTFILSAPAEFTTMAGRRLRNAVKAILEEGNIAGEGQPVYVTIAGLTNTYSSYVTTYEEYQAQRYEAASTIFGPHTHDGYIQEFSRLARDMVAGAPSASDPPPPDMTNEQLQLMPVAHADRVPVGVSFGDVVEGGDVHRVSGSTGAAGAAYTAGTDTVAATFHAANPRHDQRLQGSYLEVQLKVDDSTFQTVAVDGDWETKFNWVAGPEDPLDFGVSRTSQATVSWAIPDNAAAGQYRLCYFGDYKSITADDTDAPVAFSGCSSLFEVL